MKITDIKIHIVTGILLVVLTDHGIWAQVSEPARWDYRIVNSLNSDMVVFFEIVLDAGWYIYSTDQDPEVGPLPTKIHFKEDASYVVTNNPVPIKVEEKYDDVWNGTIRIIKSNGGGFKQSIRLLKKNAVLKGIISYTVCSEETGRCIFLEEDFEITSQHQKE